MEKKEIKLFLNDINRRKTISLIEDYVKISTQHYDASHDWHHICRVRKNALFLQETEGGNRDLIEVAALLHDVEDRKYKNQKPIYIVPLKQFLEKLFVDSSIVLDKLFAIIDAVSFCNEIKNERSIQRTKDLDVLLEAKIVQDADRMDAIGAIGIARAFGFGGSHNRPIYNVEKDNELVLEMEAELALADYESYTTTKAVDDSTFHHFYEKLIHLKGLMKTNTGKNLAEKRHTFMMEYLKTLQNEMNGLQ